MLRKYFKHIYQLVPMTPYMFNLKEATTTLDRFENTGESALYKYRDFVQN